MHADSKLLYRPRLLRLNGYPRIADMPLTSAWEEEVIIMNANAAANIVLVHGGFVDGSGWRPVYDLLTRDGYHVAVVQNPTLSAVGYGGLAGGGGVAHRPPRNRVTFPGQDPAGVLEAGCARRPVLLRYPHAGQRDLGLPYRAQRPLAVDRPRVVARRAFSTRNPLSCLSITHSPPSQRAEVSSARLSSMFTSPAAIGLIDGQP